MNNVFPREDDYKVPDGDDDVKVGVYYYKTDCAGCALVSPMVEEANKSMIGGRIDMVEVGKKYNWHGRKKMDDNVKKSMRYGGIQATPTLVWKDGIKHTGMMTTDDEPDKEGMKYYICIRCAECYLKTTNPQLDTPAHVDDEQLDNIIENIFDRGRMSDVVRNGERIKDPYHGLSAITRKMTR